VIVEVRSENLESEAFVRLTFDMNDIAQIAMVNTDGRRVHPPKVMIGDKRGEAMMRDLHVSEGESRVVVTSKGNAYEAENTRALYSHLQGLLMETHSDRKSR
jgi:hypothetical protein